MTKPRFDVLFVVLDVALLLENSAVFQSQVGEQAMALSQLGYRTGLVCVIRDAERFDTVIGHRLAAQGVVVLPVPEQGRGFAGLLLAAARVVRDVNAVRPARHAYVRGLWGPLVLALARWGVPAPYVFDVRGDLHDEMRAVGTAAWKQRVYLTLESWGLRRAAAVSAVSAALADTVRRRGVRAPIHVVPSSVAVERFARTPAAAAEARRALGIAADAVVFVYAGGLSHYQQIPAMLRLWSRFLSDDGIAFVLLTNDDPQARQLLMGDLTPFGGRLVRQSVSRDEVATVLAACDIGFALRESRALNATASPVKYAEYAAAGLAVVGSPGTGDASARAAEAGIGALVDPAELDAGIGAVQALVARIRSDRAGVKDAARALAKRHYDWTAHAGTYRALYGAPLEDR